MNLLQTCYRSIAAVLLKLTWFPPALARFVTGTVFVESGWGKLHNIEKVTEFFASLGLPAPAFQAHLVASTEFLCGGLILLGLATRFVAIPLSVIMAVALITAKREEISAWSDLFSLSEFLCIVLFVYLIIEGAGALSLDRILSWKLKNKRSKSLS